MDSSYSLGPPPAPNADVDGNESRLPGWKSMELHVRTKLLAAVRSRRHRSWHLASTCSGGDESRTYVGSSPRCNLAGRESALPTPKRATHHIVVESLKLLVGQFFVYYPADSKVARCLSCGTNTHTHTRAHAKKRPFRRFFPVPSR